MTQKGWMVGALLLLAVTGLAVGGSWMMANKVETIMVQETQQMLTRLSPLVTVVSLDYTKGLTSATRVVTLKIGNTAEAKPIVWRDDIHYGPFPHGNRFAMANIVSGFVLTEAEKVSLQRDFGVKTAPLTVNTWVGFDETVVSDVSVPSVDARLGDGSALHWQGLSGQAKVQGDQVDIQMSAPLFEVADPATQTTVKMLGYQSQGRYTKAGYWWLYTGSGETKIDSLSVSSQQQEAAEYAPSHVEMKRILSRTHTQLDDHLLTSSGQFSLDVLADNYRIDGLMLHDAVHRIHVPTLDAIVNALTTPEVLQSMVSANQDSAAFEKAMSEAATQFAKLLPFNPEYRLDKVAFSLDGAQGELALSVGVNGITEAETQHPDAMALLNKVVAQASGKIPTAWVKSLMLQDLSEADRKAISAEDMQALLNSTIEPMVQAGYVTQDGAFLKSTLSLKQGVVTLNGEQAPLLDLLADQMASD